MQERGIDLITEHKQINMKVVIQLHMLDRKAANLYQGLGGAYCDLCEFSEEQCLDIATIENGFNITRNINSLHSIFNDLQKDDGTILWGKGDYSIRTGVTNKPIATSDVVSVQFLHPLLRTFDISIILRAMSSNAKVDIEKHKNFCTEFNIFLINEFSRDLKDTLHRMWIQSDPLVNFEWQKAQPYCKFCQENGHSTRYCSKK